MIPSNIKQEMITSNHVYKCILMIGEKMTTINCQPSQTSIKRNANLKQSKMLNYDSFSVSYNDIVILTKGGRVKHSEL